MTETVFAILVNGNIIDPNKPVFSFPSAKAKLTNAAHEYLSSYQGLDLTKVGQGKTVPVVPRNS